MLVILQKNIEYLNQTLKYVKQNSVIGAAIQAIIAKYLSSLEKL